MTSTIGVKKIQYPNGTDILTLDSSGTLAVGGTLTGTTTIATASVTGNTTVGGTLNVAGAFTSLGIDDNADATAITISSSEQVGIGTSSPQRRFHIAGGSNTGLKITGNSTGTGSGDGFDIFVRDDNSGVELVQRENTFMTFHTNNTERMRIASDGKIGINSGSNPNSELHVTGSGNPVSFMHQTSTADDALVIYKHNRSTGGQQARHLSFTQLNGTEVGSISAHGSTTYFNTSSDYRLKDNVSYSFDATSRLKQLKPCQFNFKDNANTTVDGFIAHEVSAIVPEAINGEKDAVDADNKPKYQSIDQSKLIPLLVKTIQELEARITALESK